VWVDIDTNEKLSEHQDEKGFPWSHAMDSDNVSAKYGAYEIPYTVIVDKNGNLSTRTLFLTKRRLTLPNHTYHMCRLYIVLCIHLDITRGCCDLQQNLGVHVNLRIISVHTGLVIAHTQWLNNTFLHNTFIG